MVFDHLVVPVAKVIDYLFFSPSDYSVVYGYLGCIIYPLIYYICSLVIGLTYDHWFPYWFMNPTIISWAELILWFGGLLVFYLLMTWGIIKLGDFVSHRKSELSPSSLV